MNDEETLKRPSRLLMVSLAAGLGSSLSAGMSLDNLFRHEDPRAGQHPYRNDMDRHGMPRGRKKGGKLK